MKEKGTFQLWYLYEIFSFGKLVLVLFHICFLSHGVHKRVASTVLGSLFSDAVVLNNQ